MPGPLTFSRHCGHLSQEAFLLVLQCQVPPTFTWNFNISQSKSSSKIPKKQKVGLGDSCAAAVWEVGGKNVLGVKYSGVQTNPEPPPRGDIAEVIGWAGASMRHTHIKWLVGETIGLGLVHNAHLGCGRSDSGGARLSSRD